MSVPSWYELILLALAAWRTWVLVSRDTVLDGPRRYVTKGRDRLTTFIECPYCSGFWIALAWWGAFEAWPRGVVVAAGAVAVTALLPLIEKLTD